MIEFPLTPITDDTFERQGWEMIAEKEEGGDYDESQEFYYWILPLPKDNPDEKSPILISCANDDWSELNLKKGEYFVEIEDLFGLGMCTSEEELEILYRALTKQEIED
jgi:hypothetical protein|tara:strand:- start:1340 stop:1663 length:324 start_codon:yes stop_codon:yes gene_type:complete